MIMIAALPPSAKANTTGLQGNNRVDLDERVLTGLVPNATEQAALARGKALQSEGATLRAIASIWVDEFSLKKFDVNSVRRILDRT
jgi:hypothetical protein